MYQLYNFYILKILKSNYIWINNCWKVRIPGNITTF